MAEGNGRTKSECRSGFIFFPVPPVSTNVLLQVCENVLDKCTLNGVSETPVHPTGLWRICCVTLMPLSSLGINGLASLL